MSSYFKLFLVGIVFITNINSMNSQTSISAKWDTIGKMESKGLIRSALKGVEGILSDAQIQTDYVNWTKAYIYKQRLNSQLEEEGLEKAIMRMEADLASMPQPVNSIVQHFMGLFYSQLVSNNRYQNNRTEYVSENEQDIRTWSASKLERRARIHFLAFLDYPDIKNFALDGFSALFENAKKVKWSASLYDYFMYASINYFTSTSVNHQSTNTYSPDENEWLADASNFMASYLQSQDSIDYRFITSQLYQDWLSHHTKTKDIDAFDLINARRLQYGYQLTLQDSLYEQALNRAQAKSEANGCVYNYHLAQLYLGQGGRYAHDHRDKYRLKLTKAYDLAQSCKNCDLIDDGCKSILSSLEKKSYGISIEQVNPINEDITVSLRFKNIDKMYVHYFLLDEKTWFSSFRNNHGVFEIPKNVNFFKTDEILLPKEKDFQEHRIDCQLEGLRSGAYALLVSDKQEYKNVKHLGRDIKIQKIQISDMAMIQKGQYNMQTFFVLDRQSGKPMQNARISVYKRGDYQNRGLGRFVRSHNTDKQGKIEIYKPLNQNERRGRQYQELLILKKDDDQLIVDQYFYQPSEYKSKDRKVVHFFTDRSIYRPGQTIHFKGLVLNTKSGELSTVLSDEKVEVLFRDVNGQEILKESFMSNKFGSINGNFEIPTGLVNGSFSLNAIGGYHRLQVEEYKRPSFEAVFDTLKGDYVIGQDVNISGIAKNLAGNPLSQAKVDYKIVRNTYFPYWHNSTYFRYCFPSFEDTKEVAHGIISTDEQGSFNIDFLAEKNTFLNKQFSPINNYEITITVTDITGESHDYVEHIIVGPTAVKVDIENENIIDASDPKGLKLICTNYNGVSSSIKGEMTIDALKSPDKLYRERLLPLPDWTTNRQENSHPTWAYAIDLSDPSTWLTDHTVLNEEITINHEYQIDISTLNLDEGKYKISYKGKDAFNNEVDIEKFINVADLKSKKLPSYITHHWTEIENKYEVGEKISIDIFSENDLHVLVSIDRKNGTQKSYWKKVDGKETLNIAVGENDRGNFKIDLLYVKNNRQYQKTYNVIVPFTNKKLNIEYISFRDKLEPGQKEKWILKISGEQKDKIAAEMVAAMYDASLDAFLPHQWNANFYPTNNLPAYMSIYGVGQVLGDYSFGNNHPRARDFIFFPPLKNFGFPRYFGQVQFRDNMMAMAVEMDDAQADAPLGKTSRINNNSALKDGGSHNESSKPSADLQPPLIRTNLKETVFFYPDLHTDDEGNIILEFTMNEALTKWKLLTFAHTAELKYVFDSKELVTTKDFMVFPLLPRFFREGDKMMIKTKIVNLSDTVHDVTASIELNDISGKNFNSLFSLPSVDQIVSLGSKESKIVQWNISIPQVDQIDLVKLTIYARSGIKSDGEEHIIPILTNRKLVTESLPLPLKRKETRTWDLKGLARIMNSQTADLTSYTLELSSNPAWYAVLALPFLNENDNTSTTGKLNQFYANQLARHVVEKNPVIVDVANAWKKQSESGTRDAFLSQLQKNQSLKNILLEQTPWVMQAKNEDEQRRRITMLFDLNTLNQAQGQAWKEIKNRQNSDGGFAWIPGGRSDWFTSLQVLSSLLQLQELNALDINLLGYQNLVKSTISYSDREVQRQMDRIYGLVTKGHTKLSDNHLSPLVILHMFVRSHYQDLLEMTGEDQKTFDFFKGQLENYWHELSLYQQGYIALTLSKLDMTKEVPTILQSIKERSLTHEEMGRYWKQSKGYYWYQRPLETQALMIRVFYKMTNDVEFVDQLKTWLLKHKQTNAWESGRATAESIHALLSTGANSLNSGELIKANIGDLIINEDKNEAGIGYYSKTFNADQIGSDHQFITLDNPNEHIAWGAVYWQYFEDLDKIENFNDTPLSITKSLTKRVATDEGYKLIDVTDDNLKIGDRVISRIEIRVDREMEYVHLQDMRSSGFEPVDVISGYKWQDGLGYYQSAKDVSTEFFIRQLRPGTYLFEYPVKVSHEGEFSNGIASIQSYYAPEFGGHSQGEIVLVAAQ